MNFARAWISRLISLVTGIRPYTGIPHDRLQAARKSKRQCAKCEGDLHHSNKSGYCRNCWSIRSLTQALKAKGVVR